MKPAWSRHLLLLSAALWLPAAAAAGADTEARFFELRTYHAAPGKLEALLTRFRDHTLAIFQKHGMTNIGYWLPQTNSDNLLIYLLAYPSREARGQAWKEFSADPEWQAVARESERNGRLVTKVDSVFLEPTTFCPAVALSDSGGRHIYELRTYDAGQGKLPDLLARFRDHTTALFARHGMIQFGYWVPTETKDGAGQRLIYILAHQDTQAREQSFNAFRSDPEWVRVKAESEKDGPLTVPGGVKSLLLTPTDFSPAK